MMGRAEFFLQIDSHMELKKNWDSELLKMWASTNNEYAVLSSEPPDLPYMARTEEDRKVVPHLCKAKWTTRGMVRNDLSRAAANLDAPLLSNLWSGTSHYFISITIH